ncbi:MAG TPA: extracellular solute-binding protein [Mesorhizobium sp.]|jgi:spermidine/putrescine-binding protein|nr:extracellular solute-binding protein [Mesorhizobium sp.]
MNLKQRMIDRRELLAGAAAVGLSAVAIPVVARAQDSLTVYEWAGYEDPVYRPEYAAKHGDPAYSFFAEEEEALQKLLSGFQADLSHPCNASIMRWQAAGVVKPIDTSRIPRWKDIIPELLNFKGIQNDGKIWFMPYDWGFSTIGYRTDMVEEENPTYEMAIDEKYKGRFGMNGQFDVALAVAGQIAGFQNIFDPTEAEMAKLPDLFRKLVQNSKFLWTDQTEIENALANKEVVGGWLWSASVKNLRDQGIPVKVVEPVFTWACGLMLNANGGGSDDLAYEYLNAMLDPEGGKALVNSGYGHAVAASFAKADPKVVDNMGLGDIQAFFQTGKTFDSVPDEKRERLIAEWESARAG